MRHRKKKTTLDRRSGPRRQLLRVLTTNVLLHERVRTTAAKARAVRPLVERCITKGKSANILQRRRLMATLGDDRAVRKIIDVLGPRYMARVGGYTRTIRLAQRAGDRAPEVILELV